MESKPIQPTRSLTDMVEEIQRQQTPDPQKSLTENVRTFRNALADTQQSFAHRLKIAISTAVRWEMNRPPSGPALALLALVAYKNDRADYGLYFERKIADELFHDSETMAGRMALGSGEHHIPAWGSIVRVLLTDEEREWGATFDAFLDALRSKNPTTQNQARAILRSFFKQGCAFRSKS